MLLISHSGVRPAATPDSITVTRSTLPTSSQRDKPVFDKLVIYKPGFYKPGFYKPVIDKPASTPSPLLRPPKKPRKPRHNEETAHLFNNAGELIPSIPGIDAVTERLFDQGLIMSLRASLARDSYYPNGEPQGGSFVLGSSEEKKRKRDGEC